LLFNPCFTTFADDIAHIAGIGVPGDGDSERRFNAALQASVVPGEVAERGGFVGDVEA
jgi:hypothetical protein